MVHISCPPKKILKKKKKVVQTACCLLKVYFTFTFHLHALEKEMAAHSSILACRIPGTGAWWAAVYGVAQSRTRLK